MVDIVGEGATAADHGGGEAVVFEDGEIGGADEVKTEDAHFGGFAGHFVHGELVAASEYAAGDGLFEAAFARGGEGRLKGGAGKGGIEKLAASHAVYSNREEQLWDLRCGRRTG